MTDVFGAAPGKGFVGRFLSEGFEELDCLAMGEDKEKAQEFPMDAAGFRQEYREECFVDVRSLIILAILLHFGTSSVVIFTKMLQRLNGLRNLTLTKNEGLVR